MLLGNLDFALGILKFPKIRHCENLKKESNLIYQALNEIAPSALLPRNDGILEFSVMRSSGQARGWHTNAQDRMIKVVKNSRIP